MYKANPAKLLGLPPPDETLVSSSTQYHIEPR
jgi:hypothetical protein